MSDEQSWKAPGPTPHNMLVTDAEKQELADGAGDGWMCFANPAEVFAALEGGQVVYDGDGDVVYEAWQTSAVDDRGVEMVRYTYTPHSHGGSPSNGRFGPINAGVDRLFVLERTNFVPVSADEMAELFEILGVTSSQLMMRDASPADDAGNA